MAQDDLFSFDPDPIYEPLKPLPSHLMPESGASELQKGLIRGGKYFRGGLRDAMRAAGSAVGADEEYDADLRARTEEDMRDVGRFKADVESFRGVEDPGTAFKYAMGKVGESVPYMASAIASGGAVGVGARLLLGAALPSAGAVTATALATKTLSAAKKLTDATQRADAVAKATRGLRAAQQAEKASGLARRTTQGRQVGGYLGITVPETGHTFAEIEKETGEQRPGLALAGGMVKGALEGYSLGRSLRAIRPGNQTWLKDVGKAIGREGTTEALQELTDVSAVRIAKGDNSVLTDGEFERALEAAVAGATVGGITVGAGGAIARTPGAINKTAAAYNKMINGELVSMREFADMAREQYGAEQAVGAVNKQYSKSFTSFEEVEEYMRSQETEDLDYQEQQNVQEVTLGEIEGGATEFFGEDGSPLFDYANNEGFEGYADNVGNKLDTLNKTDRNVADAVDQAKYNGATDEELAALERSLSPYEVRSYLDYLEEEATREGVDFETYARKKAKELAGKSKKLEAKMRELGIRGFLEQFKYIASVKPETQFERDEFELPKTDIYEGKYPLIKELGYDKKTKRSFAYPGNAKIRVKDKNEKWTERALDVQQLIRRSMPLVGDVTNDQDRMNAALNIGLTTLATSEHVGEIDLASFEMVNADAVVFEVGRGKDAPKQQITLSQLRGKGEARARAKLAAAETRKIRARKKLYFMRDKMRRLKVIPNAIIRAENEAAVKKLEAEFTRIRNQHPALERDMVAAAKELEQVEAGNLKKKGREALDKLYLSLERARAELAAIQVQLKAGKDDLALTFESKRLTKKIDSVLVNLTKAERAYLERKDYVFVRPEDQAARVSMQPIIFREGGYNFEAYDDMHDADRVLHSMDPAEKYVNPDEEITNLTPAQFKNYSLGNGVHDAPFESEKQITDTVWETDPQYLYAKAVVAEMVHKVNIGTDVRLLTPLEAKWLVDSVQDYVDLVEGSEQGYHINSERKRAKLVQMLKERGAPENIIERLTTGDAIIYINPLMTPERVRITAAHEVGHHILDNAILNISEKQMFDILDEYGAWIGDIKEGRRLKDIYRNRPDQIQLYMQRGILPDSKLDLESEHVKYMMNFEEWFADRARNRLLDKTPPKTNVERFFENILEAFRRLLRVQDAPYDTVEDFVDTLIRTRQPYWSNLNDPVQVLRGWDKDRSVSPNDTANGGTRDNQVYDDIVKYYRRVMGEDISDAQVAILLQAAMSQGTDPFGAVFNEVFTQASQLLLKPEELNIVARAAQSPHVMRQLRQLLKNDKQAWQAAQNDSARAASYVYQFWMTGQINLSKRHNRLYQKVFDFFKEVLGMVTDSENAEMLFENFTNGNALLRKDGDNESFFAVKTATRNTRIQRAVHDQLAPAWEKVAGSKVGRALFSAAATRLYDTGNAALIDLANMMSYKVGEEGRPEDMLAARTHFIGMFRDQVRNIFEGHEDDTELANAVAEILNNGETLQEGMSEEQVQAHRMAERIRKLYARIYKYMVDKDMNVGHVENYSPWIFNMEYLRDNEAAFMELFSSENFAPYLEEMQTTPQQLYMGLMQTEGFSDIEVDLDAVGHIPAFGSMNTRRLKWIDKAATPEQRKQFGEFLDRDLGVILNTYIEQSVKRTEYNVRFGGGKLNSLLSRAAQTGATPEDIELARAFIDSVMGTYGYETNRKLASMLNMEPPPAGEIINKKLQRGFGVMMVYQNIRVLGMATLTSLADPIGIAVRTGDIGMAFNSYKNGIKAAYKNAKGEESTLISLGETLGIIDRHMTIEALNWEYGGVYIRGAERRINEVFFRAIGLQALTRTTRIMGLDAGLSFLTRHVTNPNQHSERFLSELDLSAEDVKLNEEGKVHVLTSRERHELNMQIEALDASKTAERIEMLEERLGEMEDSMGSTIAEQEGLAREIEDAKRGLEQTTEQVKQLEAEISRDNRVRNALHRFVDGAILRPNATLRPIWASDPHYMLFFHLRSFMYAFHERILKRVVTEAANGHMMPMMMLGAFIPVMMASDMLRDLIQHGTEGNPRKSEWGWYDHAWNSTQRAGLLGLGQIAMDAGNDIQFGGLGIESFLGPSVQQIDDVIDFGGLIEDNVDVTEGLPFQNVYKYWEIF